MYTLDDAYGQKFFAQRRSLEWRVPVFCNAIIEAYPSAKSVIDFGCGNADLVRGFMSYGLDAYGIEGTMNCIPYIKVPCIDAVDVPLSIHNRVMIHDLRYPIKNYFEEENPRLVDLALCLEVAEHLEVEYVDDFLYNIIRVANNIVFTAAPPGQGGNHHVNLQSRQWWIEYFNNYNYELDYISYHIVKHKLEQSGKARIKGIKAWYTNLMCFRKKE